MLEEIKKLRQSYENGTPEVSDFEYDTLVTKFLSKGGSYRDIYGDSLLKEEYEMMSQQNVYTNDDLFKVLDYIEKNIPNNIEEIIFTPKYDGCSIYFVFDKELQKPIYVYSRHKKRLKPFIEKQLIENFQNSEISENTRIYKDINPKHKYGYIRTEAIIGKDVFKEKGYDKIYSNPRNMVAGLLNRKNPTEEHKDIELKLFDFNSELDYPILLEEDYCSFDISTLKEMSIEDIDKELRKYYRDILQYFECDGFVGRLSNTKLRNELGNDGHHWYCEFAIKNQQREELTTTLLNVEWNMADNGKFTPVGIVEPIQFKDAIVSRVMLNSNKFIDENDIKIGSKLTIIKSGDIIPVVIESEGGDTIIQIDECPHCESMTIDKGAYSFCPNPDCDEKKLLLLIKQIVKIQELLNLKGISSAIIKKIFEQNKNDIFYYLVFDLSSKFFEGVGEVNLEKFRNIFKKLRNSKITIGNLFSLLQVQGFGNETMEKLDNYLIENRHLMYSGKQLKSPDTWKNVIRGFFIENTSIDKNVWININTLLSDSSFINKIKLSKLQFHIPELNENDLLLPKYIFTGSPIGMTKNQFKKFMEGKAIQVSSVPKADYVICNDPSKNSKKYQDGIKFNKKVLNQENFLKEIEK